MEREEQEVKEKNNLPWSGRNSLVQFPAGLLISHCVYVYMDVFPAGLFLGSHCVRGGGRGFKPLIRVECRFEHKVGIHLGLKTIHKKGCRLTNMQSETTDFRQELRNKAVLQKGSEYINSTRMY